jgi:hypothetical protein
MKLFLQPGKEASELRQFNFRKILTHITLYLKISLWIFTSIIEKDVLIVHDFLGGVLEQ